MKTKRISFFAALVAAGVCLAASGAAKDVLSAPGAEPASHDLILGFLPKKLALGIVAMPLAAFLVYMVAYHPYRTKSLGVKKEEWETPKALILIAVAGVMVGALVSVESSMAFALFGFGSFIRFRTQVKNPKETVIIFLAAGIGCLCGLEQFWLALAATGFVLLLITIMDRTRGGTVERITLLLKGLDGQAQNAAKLYKEKLKEANVEVVSSKVSLKKGNLTLLLDKPVKTSTDQIEEMLFSEEGLPRPRSIEWIRE